jgi:hypothetical protein
MSPFVLVVLGGRVTVVARYGAQRSKTHTRSAQLPPRPAGGGWTGRQVESRHDGRDAAAGGEIEDWTKEGSRNECYGVKRLILPGPSGPLHS